jgi:hypothetical protein
LGGVQPRLVLDGELVTPSPEASSPGLVHGCFWWGCDLSQSRSGGLRSRRSTRGVMDPGCFGVSGGARRLTAVGCVCVPRVLGGAGWNKPQRNSKLWRERLPRGNDRGDMRFFIYTPRTGAYTQSASLSRSYFWG